MASPFVGKDGSRHTNRSTMMQADARHAAKQPKESVVHGANEDRGDDGMDDGSMQGQQDGSQMAAEHGPATELDIQHDHEGGRHMVHAVHPDGHAHDSEHGSADEAHQYAAQCAGCGGGM